MTANIIGPGWKASHILFDKFFVLFLLSLSTVGLDFMIRRLFAAYQGGQPVIADWKQGLVFKFCFSLSVAVWTVILFMGWSYASGVYSTGQVVLSGLGSFVVILSILLAVSNRWLNAVTSGDFRK